MFDGLFAPAIGMIIYFLVLFWRYKGITIPYHLVSFYIKMKIIKIYLIFLFTHLFKNLAD